MKTAKMLNKTNAYIGLQYTKWQLLSFVFSCTYHQTNLFPSKNMGRGARGYSAIAEAEILGQQARRQ